ncbi:lipopolysaccharide biosynthesis protein [Microbacterium hydrothermale]|uniref:lipopolysaccharide biosynthesis protein n=1 Tax=Microbacterium hydrothermale TaxID=857427 RepID=UPI0010A78629|nr:oligosaccharide flippase family protein [Microbacterium hydrothermale]
MRRQFVQLFVARTCASLFQVLAILYLARLVGPSELGPVVAFVGVGAFLAAVSDLGIGTYLLKERAATPHSPLIRPALKTNDVLTLALIVGGVASALVLGLGTAEAILLGVWIGLEKNTDTHLSIPTADGAVGVVSAINFVRRLVGLVLFVLLALAVAPVLAFCIAQLVGAVYGVSHAHLVLRRSTHSVSGVSRPSRQALRGSFPFWVAVTSAQVRELDSAIVGAVAGPAAAGLYGAGARLSRPALLVASALATVLLPSATKGGAAVARKAARGLYLLTLLGGVMGIIAALLAEPLLPLLLGDDFSGAIPATQVLLISMSVVALCSPLGGLIQARGGERYTAANGVIFAVVTVVGLTIGSSVAGPLGAAVGVSVSYAMKFASLAIKLHSLNRREAGEKG